MTQMHRYSKFKSKTVEKIKVLSILANKNGGLIPRDMAIWFLGYARQLSVRLKLPRLSWTKFARENLSIFTPDYCECHVIGCRTTGISLLTNVGL